MPATTRLLFCKTANVNILQQSQISCLPAWMAFHMKLIPHHLPRETGFLSTQMELQRQQIFKTNSITVMKYAIGKAPRDVVDIVRNDIDEFVNNAPQFDDITMLAMSFLGR